MERSLLANYQDIHGSNRYGQGGSHFPYVLAHVMALKPRSILDYGAGKSDIAVRLGRRSGSTFVYRFDPAIPEISKTPDGRFDLVVSFDVLEHIPEQEIDSALSEMARMADHALFVIDMRPSKHKTLADGRNVHVSLHDVVWWHERLKRFFPGIMPFEIRSPRRATFKTWPDVLPARRRLPLEVSERLAFFLRKKWEKYRRRRQR